MIKTYPVVMTDDYHAEVVKAARKQGKSLKEYIIEAINEKIEKDQKEGQHET